MNNRITRKEFVNLLAVMPLLFPKSKLSKMEIQNIDAFPAKEEFEIKGTYLNAAYTHPMSRGSANQIKTFLNERLMNGKNPVGYDAFERDSEIEKFARLINAEPDEIAWIPSTMFGENFIVEGLSLPGSKQRVVTDAFHFNGSLHLYNQLQKQGLDVFIVKPENNHIDMNDLDSAIKPGTRLVSISLVSATTGFLHDLKKVCELAHSRGALVYADIIQAAGAIPIDVKVSDVDFCACSTYKWLMGDFGIGFLYVNKQALHHLKRTVIGYRQILNSENHFLPFDSISEKLFDSESKEDVPGHFEVGTFANTGISALRYSLDYLNRVGVVNIQKYRRPMIDRLKQQLPDDRFILLTPINTDSPIVSFAFKDAEKVLKPHLEGSGISISLYDHMIRISPSFYNDMDDIDKLIHVLRSVS